MKYRKLGRTGLDVSQLGFGTWQIGGGRWSQAPDAENVALLRNALDLGVNVYDAAYVYGQYRNNENVLVSRSLELLGKAFGHDSSLTDATYVCLKLGQLDEWSHSADYSPRRLIENYRHALALLKRKTVDICLIHAPSLAEVEQGRALAVLETLKCLGDVRAVGYSFETEAELVAAALKQDVDVLMLQYNLIDEECSKVLDAAARQGVGVLVGGPFKRGYLTGRYLKLHDLPKEDSYWAWNVARNPGKVEGVLATVRNLLEANGSPCELRRKALAHVLAKPAVGSAIVGHRQSEEVTENVGFVSRI